LKQDSGNEVNPFSIAPNATTDYNDHTRLDGALAGFGLNPNAINQQFSEDFTHKNTIAVNKG
jgi:hypothetical protein